MLDYELEFQRNAGKIIGAIQHLEESSKDVLKVEILSQEAISTSNIEGEVLNRDSVQSSIRRHYSIRTVYFLIEKAKFFLKHQSQLNERQAKVLLRVFDDGVEGFKGGLSAQNYKSITGASPATVTRDLQDLVQMGALNKTGESKHTRYALNFSYLL